MMTEKQIEDAAIEYADSIEKHICAYRSGLKEGFIEGVKRALSMSGVSNCISYDLVDCGNCGEKVKMISTGHMCPKCYC